MNLLVDESVERQIADRLRQDNHVVIHITRTAPGISDDLVLDLANQDAAVLITADKDFGEMVFRKHRYAFGVVLIRVSDLSLAGRIVAVADAIRNRATELPGAFTVVSPGFIRVRRQLDDEMIQ